MLLDDPFVCSFHLPSLVPYMRMNSERWHRTLKRWNAQIRPCRVYWFDTYFRKVDLSISIWYSACSMYCRMLPSWELYCARVRKSIAARAYMIIVLSDIIRLREEWRQQSTAALLPLLNTGPLFDIVEICEALSGWSNPPVSCEANACRLRFLVIVAERWDFIWSIR